MDKRAEYLRAIAQRGDQYGGHGGLLSLLEWCGKYRIPDVTEEEARRFVETPHTPYTAKTE